MRIQGKWLLFAPRAPHLHIFTHLQFLYTHGPLSTARWGWYTRPMSQLSSSTPSTSSSLASSELEQRQRRKHTIMEGNELLDCRYYELLPRQKRSLFSPPSLLPSRWIRCLSFMRERERKKKPTWTENIFFVKELWLIYNIICKLNVYLRSFANELNRGPIWSSRICTYFDTGCLFRMARSVIVVLVYCGRFCFEHSVWAIVHRMTTLPSQFVWTDCSKCTIFMN